MLTLGQLVIPFVPTVFSHLLLLTDSKHLSYLLNTKPSMWYIAGVSASDMHRYTSLYDMCFDLGTKKFYANSTWKVCSYASIMNRIALWSQRKRRCKIVDCVVMLLLSHQVIYSGWSTFLNTKASSGCSSESSPI